MSEDKKITPEGHAMTAPPENYKAVVSIESLAIKPDDTPQPNTARFWRLNTIDAYRGVNLNERLAQDPEHLQFMQEAKAELVQLRAREQAVKTRHARIYGRKATP